MALVGIQQKVTPVKNEITKETHYYIQIIIEGRPPYPLSKGGRILLFNTEEEAKEYLE